MFRRADRSVAAIHEPAPAETLEPAASPAEPSAGTAAAAVSDSADLWAEYAAAATVGLHTSTDNIDWMVERSIDSWVFDYEAILEFWYAKLIPLRHGMIYDIGAHLGRHTAVFARFGRPVMAFEPLPHIRERLVQNCASFGEVVIRQEALGDSTGAGTFTVNQNALEESGIKRRVYNDEQHADVTEIEVQLARLDDVHTSTVAIAFVKIDTEGGEIGILRGGRRVLTTFRPILSVEYGSPGYSVYGHKKGDLLAIADDYGYHLYDIFGYRIDASNADRAIDAFAWDYLMLPADDAHLAAAVMALRLHLASTISNFLRHR
jgi:FkbM family methyltransferase